MSDRYAVVDADGKVVNVVLWDGQSDWVPPEGSEAVQSDDADIGWVRDSGGNLVAPQAEAATSEEQA